MPHKDDRFRSKKPITFLGFIDDMRKLWKNAGLPGDISRKSPFNKDAEFPLITFRTLHRSLDPNFKEKKPRYRDTIPHPHIPNEWIDLYGQMFQVDVEFKIYSKSQEEADEILIEFEEFLEMYKGEFKKNGVQEILFSEQKEDEVLTESRIEIAARTIVYTLRLERIVPKMINQIDGLAVDARILHKN